MQDLTIIYDTIYEQNGDIIDVREVLEAALDILPDKDEPALNKVHALLKIAAAQLGRIRAQLDNACDFTAATKRKLAVLTD